MKRNLSEEPLPNRWNRQSVTVPLPHATTVFGPSKSWFYRQAAAGNVKLIKIGRGTYVDTRSVLATLQDLADQSATAAHSQVA